MKTRKTIPRLAVAVCFAWAGGVVWHMSALRPEDESMRLAREHFTTRPDYAQALGAPIEVEVEGVFRGLEELKARVPDLPSDLPKHTIYVTCTVRGSKLSRAGLAVVAVNDLKEPSVGVMQGILLDHPERGQAAVFLCKGRWLDARP